MTGLEVVDEWPPLPNKAAFLFLKTLDGVATQQALSRIANNFLIHNHLVHNVKEQFRECQSLCSIIKTLKGNNPHSLVAFNRRTSFILFDHFEWYNSNLF